MCVFFDTRVLPIGLYLALPPSSTELQGCWVSHKLMEGWQKRSDVGHFQSGQQHQKEPVPPQSTDLLIWGCGYNVKSHTQQQTSPNLVHSILVPSILTEFQASAFCSRCSWKLLPYSHRLYTVAKLNSRCWWSLTGLGLWKDCCQVPEWSDDLELSGNHLKEF